MKTKFRTLIKKPKYQKKQGMLLFLFIISCVIIIGFGFVLVNMMRLIDSSWGIIAGKLLGILFCITFVGEFLLYFATFKILKIQERETEKRILKFKNNGKEIKLEGNLKICYWYSFRFREVNGGFFDNLAIETEMGFMDDEPGHSTSFVLHLIVEDEKGEQVFLTESLGPWRDEPKGWEYYDAVFAKDNEFFMGNRLQKMVKVLEQKEQVTYANLL